MCPPFNIYERLISFCSVNLPEKYVTLLLDIFLDTGWDVSDASVGELLAPWAASCQDSWSGTGEWSADTMWAAAVKMITRPQLFKK